MRSIKLIMVNTNFLGPEGSHLRTEAYIYIYAMSAHRGSFVCTSGRVGQDKSPILGRFPAQPGPLGSWERPRQGPRSIGTDVQPGKPSLRLFREVFELLVPL